jgi:hypothetical protein
MADIKKTVIPVAVTDEKLAKNIDEVLRTEAGRALWAHLFHICGYNQSSLTLNRQTGEVASLSTECKEAQRRIYLDIRNRASRELRAVAEELAETPIAAPIPEEERK